MYKKLFLIFPCILMLFFTSAYALIVQPDKSLLSTDTIIFDLRPLEEFKKERVKDSIHLDYEYFEPQLLNKNYVNFITFLRLAGVNENSKIFFLINNENDIKKSAFLGFFLNLLGVKNIKFIDGGISYWKQSGLPTQTIGRKLEPKNFQPKINENTFFEKPDKNFFKQKNIIILKTEQNLNDIVKGVISINIEDFYTNGKLREIYTLEEFLHSQKIEPNKKIFLYPEQSEKTYIIAFLLKNYLEYENVKILKGDESLWLKLKILQKR